MKGKCKQCGRTVDDIVNNSHNYCDVTHDDSFYSKDFCSEECMDRDNREKGSDDLK